MSALPHPPLVTIEEFNRVVRQQEERDFELFEGEILEVTFPVWKHILTQKRLVDLLTQVAGTRGLVLSEAPYQLSQLNRQVKRRADVAYIADARCRDAHEAGILEGAPDLVIEVLSPANSASQMYRLERICLSNGSQEFWTIDLEEQSVRVVRSNVVNVYQRGESVPLPMFQADPLLVDRIFEEIF